MKLILGTLILSTLALGNDCIKVKAVFDIGSKNTKFKVAEVDTCKRKVLKVLMQETESVGYKQSLERSEDNNLTPTVVADGIRVIKSYMNQAASYNPASFSAIATSAFRTANNGQLVANLIEKETGLKIKIITQEQEARLGFVAAAVATDIDLNKLVVWDIGGGSMQMSAYQAGKNLIYKGRLASDSFMNLIIRDVQGQDLSTIATPNPISAKNTSKAGWAAEVYADVSVPDTFKELLQKSSTQVVGIGGVHYHSIGKVINDRGRFTLHELYKKVSQEIDKTDEELGGGKYVNSSVSNSILVASFMKRLKINQVLTSEVSLGDGLLVMPSILD